MMVFRLGGLIELFLLLLSSTPHFTLGCGSVEEGRQTALRCETSDVQDFTTFGVRVTSGSGDFRYVSICRKNGSCSDNEPDYYHAKLTKSLDESNGRSTYKLLLIMDSVNRNDTQLHCVKDGITQAQCELDVYVKPDKPACSRPSFAEDGADLLLQCTADNVYPRALCSFYFVQDKKMKLDDSLVHSFHQPSIRHPGNKLVTCELRMPVQNLQEGDYHLLAAVQPSVPERSDDDLVYADYPSNVKLSTVTLSYQMSKSTTFSVETGSDLQTELDITGNPPPNRFILTLRTSKKSNILTIPNGDYNVSFSNRKLTLTLKDVGKSGLGFGYYTFHASNGINGTSPELKYTFKVTLLEEGDDDNSARKVGILLAIGLNSALMIFSIFGCVLLCRRNRRRKLQSRGSNYASPNEACYIYPNMGFQPDPNEYGSPQNPPSYESVYATPNECMESDSTPQAARHVKRQEVPRGSTGTASQCGELAVRLQ